MLGTGDVTRIGQVWKQLKRSKDVPPKFCLGSIGSFLGYFGGEGGFFFFFFCLFVFLVILHLICVLCVMKKNCSKHLQKCERVTLLGSWQSLSRLWVLSSGQCQLWEKVEGKTGLFGRKMRALDQCGSCVRVAMARILSVTDQTAPQ